LVGLASLSDVGRHAAGAQILMGRRSDFERRDQDFYPTPRAAVLPLLPYVPQGTKFIEPCAGDGTLVRVLESFGHHCVDAFDVEPRISFVRILDARWFRDTQNADMFITNPPWARAELHGLIRHLSALLPTWLLFDADWPHTLQARTLIKHCASIVSIGRVKWIENSKHTGKDNSCWYFFPVNHTAGPHFYGRTAWPWT
jgi:hypothetical protein